MLHINVEALKIDQIKNVVNSKVTSISGLTAVTKQEIPERKGVDGGVLELQTACFQIGECSSHRKTAKCRKRRVYEGKKRKRKKIPRLKNREAQRRDKKSLSQEEKGLLPVIISNLFILSFHVAGYRLSIICNLLIYTHIFMFFQPIINHSYFQ